MNKPEVVVCIPAYNSENTIAETLYSLLNQTFPIQKIKIFDNASTDNTQKIIQEFIDQYPQIILIKSDVNIGGEANFTRCIQNVEGDYSLVAHTDDIYLPTFIEKMILALEAHPQALAAFSKAQFIDEKSNVTSERFFPNELKEKNVTVLNFHELLGLVLKYANFITCPGVVVRSQIFLEQIKIWNGKDFKTSADLDVWFRIAKNGPLLAINETLINYRASEASYSFRIAKRRVTKHDMFLVIDDYFQKYKNELTDLQVRHYEFLNLKDKALVLINKIRNRDKILKMDFYQLKLKFILGFLFESSWHRKFLLYIVGIFFYAYLYTFFKGTKIEN